MSEDENLPERSEASLTEIGNRLGRKRLESAVPEAEVDGVQGRFAKDVQSDPAHPEQPGLVLHLERVDGSHFTDWLPEPSDWDPDQYDLCTLFEFLGLDPSNPSSVMGARVPIGSSESVDYRGMRTVLQRERHAKREWDVEKRREKYRQYRGE